MWGSACYCTPLIVLIIVFPMFRCGHFVRILSKGFSMCCMYTFDKAYYVKPSYFLNMGTVFNMLSKNINIVILFKTCSTNIHILYLTMLNHVQQNRHKYAHSLGVALITFIIVSSWGDNDGGPGWAPRNRLPLIKWQFYRILQKVTHFSHIISLMYVDNNAIAVVYMFSDAFYRCKH